MQYKGKACTNEIMFGLAFYKAHLPWETTIEYENNDDEDNSFPVPTLP